jgi:uncharacterized membrane protein
MQTKTQIKKGSRVSLISIAVLVTALALALSACSSNNTGGTGNVGNNSAVANDSQTVKSGENLVIQVKDISDAAKFYPVTVDGTKMEVVAVKAPDGTIRTAFNTCQVCSGSPRAYFEQSGTYLQCQNCGNKFLMDRVGLETGGCNPIPILGSEKTETDESITILYDTLKANITRFPSNWKTT